MIYVLHFGNRMRQNWFYVWIGNSCMSWKMEIFLIVGPIFLRRPQFINTSFMLSSVWYMQSLNFWPMFLVQKYNFIPFQHICISFSLLWQNTWGKFKNKKITHIFRVPNPRWNIPIGSSSEDGGGESVTQPSERERERGAEIERQRDREGLL